MVGESKARGGNGERGPVIRRHKFPIPHSPIFMAIGVAVAACATFRAAIHFDPPEFQLQEIHITGLGLTGGTFDLVFDVYNPNDYALKSTRLEVGLDLEGTHFGDALIDRPLEYQAKAHGPLTVPVRFDWAGVGAGAEALLERQAVRYGYTGSVMLDTPLGDKKVGLHGSGDLPLSKLRP